MPTSWFRGFTITPEVIYYDPDKDSKGNKIVDADGDDERRLLGLQPALPAHVLIDLQQLHKKPGGQPPGFLLLE